MLRQILAKKISLARKESGMTQKQVADLIGVHLNAVGKWELGKSSPELDNVESMAQVFGKDPTWFFEPERDGVWIPRYWAMSIRDMLTKLGVPLPDALIQFQNWHDLTNHVHPLVVTSPPPEDMPGTQLATVSSPIDPHSSWVECFSLPCVASAFAV